VVLELAFGHPFMASTLASTVAVALLAPSRYRRDLGVIARSYAVALPVAVALSILGSALSLPSVLTATVAAVLVIAIKRGRLHPPAASVPFAVTVTGPIRQLVLDWLLVAAMTSYLLLALVPAAVLLARHGLRTRS
jgi:hypothetical protein